MSMLRIIIAILSVLQSVVAFHSFTVIENINLPAGWSVSQVPNDTQLIILRIGLKQRNLDLLIDRLYSVSDPDSPSYGQYYEREEIDDLVKPEKEADEKISAWLKNSGVKYAYSDGHWINLLTTIGTANELLNTQFKLYERDGNLILRTLQYSIPNNLARYIDLITPTTYFGRPSPQAPSQTKASSQRLDEVTLGFSVKSCSTYITPNCLKALYNIKNYVPQASSGSKIGFASFLEQSAIYNDLYQFQRLFGLPKQSFNVESIQKGENNQSASLKDTGEANLDVQNIMGLASSLPVTEYVIGGLGKLIPNGNLPTQDDNTNEPYLAYYKYLLAKPNSQLPQVISNSYGDDEQTVPFKFAYRVCNQIAMMGLRGITILESSGDTGVGAPCQSNDGKAKPEFTPQFPGSCPYVTAVGGTQEITINSPYEIAWRNGSGGFSNYFPQPKYQAKAVKKYLNNMNPSTLEYYKPFFNRHGRGFPDISAHSVRPGYIIVQHGDRYLSGGTSAAAPVWAAIIGLLNDARLRAGKPALGFLNPLLYKRGHKALHDIKHGGSVGCTGVNAQTGDTLNRSSIIPYASWNATAGWDPVTGLGTPDFQKLKAMVLNL